jgi:hypothetical protein
MLIRRLNDHHALTSRTRAMAALKGHENAIVCRVTIDALGSPSGCAIYAAN